MLHVQENVRYLWNIHGCLTNIDRIILHVVAERMYRSCKEYDNFIENHPISFDQQAMCIIVQFVDNCSNLG